MKKSVYSITLLDDVVRGIDRAAYERGTSRSGLINRILAEYLSMSTPETRQERVFTELLKLCERDRDFRLLSEPSGSLLAIKSSISFKYNPTIRYSVALYRDGGEHFGELRAALRTQNPALVSEVCFFFALWQDVETAYLGRPPAAECAGGRYTRRLAAPKGAEDAALLGRATARYIRTLHDAVSAYFDAIPDRGAAARRIAEIYDDYARSGTHII